jgi:hypothetical protein
MREYYVHHIQPVDDRTNAVVICRRSTGKFQGIRVRVYWWDRMVGLTLLDKSIAMYARAQKACDKANRKEAKAYD